MNEYVVRWLATALLKETGGEPVRLTPTEIGTGFEMTFASVDHSDDLVVTVAPGTEDDEQKVTEK